MAQAIQEKVILTPKQLDSILSPGKMVHTFVQGGFMLLGADWSRKKILALAGKHGAELSGEQATAMKHGAIVWRPDEARPGKLMPLFLETIDNAATILSREEA